MRVSSFVTSLRHGIDRQLGACPCIILARTTIELGEGAPLGQCAPARQSGLNSFMKLEFHTLDVFTTQRFGGNPLAIIPDAEGLSDEQMQTIAREFNLSETVFVLKPATPAHSARVRIFTPYNELPFAGHPTVGAAILLAGIRQPSINGERDAIVTLEACPCSILD